MPEKETFSVRLSPDMADAVREYAEEHDVSRADTLRRAIRDQYLRPTPDGGEVADRLDQIEEQQERSDRLDAAGDATLVAGLAYITANFLGWIDGLVAVAIGIVLLGTLVAVSAYRLAVAGWSP